MSQECPQESIPRIFGPWLLSVRHAPGLSEKGSDRSTTRAPTPCPGTIWAPLCRLTRSSAAHGRRKGCRSRRSVGAALSNIYPFCPLFFNMYPKWPLPWDPPEHSIPSIMHTRLRILHHGIPPRPGGSKSLPVGLKSLPASLQSYRQAPVGLKSLPAGLKSLPGGPNSLPV